jgi:transposase InsO family protein
MGEAYISNNSGSIFELTNVIYAPDLHRPLISLNRLFTNSITLLKTYNSFIIKFDDSFSLSGTIHNNLLEVSNPIEMKNVVSLYHAMSSKANWHARLGHPSHPYLKRMIEDVEVVDCVTCKMCKATKLPFKGKFTPTSQVLEAIHLDLVRPFQTRSVGGAQYFLTIVNQFSGFKTIKLLKHKSETLNKFKEFVIWAENQTGQTIKRIISDNGGEFKNIFFQDFCRNRRISQQFSPRYTPENNGMSEQSNCAILDKARCLFAQANPLATGQKLLSLLWISVTFFHQVQGTFRFPTKLSLAEISNFLTYAPLVVWHISLFLKKHVLISCCHVGSNFPGLCQRLLLILLCQDRIKNCLHNSECIF